MIHYVGQSASHASAHVQVAYFSPVPILSALKFYTALFSPTLAVFCVLFSYQGNYFSLSNYFIFMQH